MSKKRRFHRQSATNPAQIRASHPQMRIPVTLDNGDGTPKTVMVTEAQLAALQRRGKARTIEASTDNGTQTTLTVADNAPARTIKAEVQE